MTNWTRDADGNYVDWLRPPYRVGSILRLVLPGEDPGKLTSATRQQRIIEYYKLVRRDFRRSQEQNRERPPSGEKGDR